MRKQFPSRPKPGGGGAEVPPVTLRAFLPMSRAELAAQGRTSIDILLVGGDAYVDHPSFGLALLAACSKPKASAWAFAPNRTGKTRMPL